MDEINLREFLYEGCVIRTKICESHIWVTNIVYGINEDSIEIDIGLERNYIDNMIMIGDTMKCKYAADDKEYTIWGWVTRIRVDFPQSITIRVHEVITFNNNRNSYRYDVYLSSVLKSSSEEVTGIFGIVTNISNTGAAFIVHEEIEKAFKIEGIDVQDTGVILDIYISPEKKLTFEGVIMRRGEQVKGIEYGIRIIDIDKDNDKILNDFILELANMDKELYNKRYGFWSKNSKFKNSEG